MDNLRTVTYKQCLVHLESPRKLQSLLESPWNSVLTLSNPVLKYLKEANTERPSGSNCSCCGRTKKDILKAFFALNRVLEKCEMCSWKSLKFFVQKRVRALYTGSHLDSEDDYCTGCRNRTIKVNLLLKWLLGSNLSQISKHWQNRLNDPMFFSTLKC